MKKRRRPTTIEEVWRKLVLMTGERSLQFFASCLFVVDKEWMKNE
jgi:hypothetical protein